MRRQAHRAYVGALRAALYGLLCCTLYGGCADDAHDGKETPPAGSCPMDLPSNGGCPQAAPSYTRVIAPIVEQRCQGCHYEGNPFSSVVLADYEGVFAARRTALTLVYGCRMPPAEAAPLSAEERQALMLWLVCGAPAN